MATIYDVAKYILDKNGQMSTWKLQKLCYYAQAWALAWTGNPLFENEFQAWSNGPVSPDLFRQHQGKYSINSDDLKIGDINKLSDDEKDTIDVVLRDYGDMEPYDLREQTHRESPWIIARNGIPDGVRSNNIITKDSMGEYYGSL